jgi:carbonic anhydrase/acetyltransferase-like protein (isoleucine patch superfamily)
MCHVSHKNAGKPLGSPQIIGEYATIAHLVILYGCVIGDENLIGMGIIVMDNVVFERHVMVGAGAWCRGAPQERLPVCGPAGGKERPLTEAEIVHLRYSTEHCVREKNNYLADVDSTSSSAHSSVETHLKRRPCPRVHTEEIQWVSQSNGRYFLI